MSLFSPAPMTLDDLSRLADIRRQRAEASMGIVAMGTFLYALLRRDYLLVGLLGTYLAAGLTAYVYRRLGARGVTLEVRVRPRRVFPGQPVELRARLTNRKRLPLPWARLGLSLPHRAEVEELSLTRTPLWQRLSLPLSVGGRQSVERRLRMRLPVRGLHRLGPTDLTVADPLGMESTTTELRAEGGTLVYPRLAPIGAQLRQALPIGERRGRSFVDEPSRYLGPRTYRPGDPLRRIDWRRTAVLGELHVRTYETVATSASALFLDPTTARHTWEGIDPEVLERTISLAAGLAHHLIGRGEAVGLYVTGVFSESAGRRPFSMRERPRSGARQLARILEALAQLRPPGLFRDLPAIMLEEVPRLDYAVQVIVIAPYLAPDLAPVLARLSRSRRVFFLATGSAQPGVDAPLPPLVRPLHLESGR